MARIIKEFAPTDLPSEKDTRLAAIKDFTAKLQDHPVVKEVGAAVNQLTAKFPVPGIE